MSYVNVLLLALVVDSQGPATRERFVRAVQGQCSALTVSETEQIPVDANTEFVSKSCEDMRKGIPSFPVALVEKKLSEYKTAYAYANLDTLAKMFSNPSLVQRLFGTLPEIKSRCHTSGWGLFRGALPGASTYEPFIETNYRLKGISPAFRAEVVESAGHATRVNVTSEAAIVVFEQTVTCDKQASSRGEWTWWLVPIAGSPDGWVIYNAERSR